MVLTAPGIREKIKNLDSALHALSLGKSVEEVPEQPARDATVVRLSELPPKPGLSTLEGQARLLHDLASIELQAMELGLRTLAEYPEADPAFRDELALITRGEGEHLALCLDALDAMGFGWGRWPVHNALWNAVSRGEDLLERILIVHRHLEGSGLDSGESILRRLTGSIKTAAKPAVERIVREEVGHVEFGSRWYRAECAERKLDPDDVFKDRMPAIARAVPRRDRLAWELRRRAGFNETEIAFLEELQKQLPGIVPRSTRLEDARAGRA